MAPYQQMVFREVSEFDRPPPSCCRPKARLGRSSDPLPDQDGHAVGSGHDLVVAAGSQIM
jgi:hypothetical protein